MIKSLTWDGVDWFGCRDDLTWEPSHDQLAKRSDARSAAPARNTARDTLPTVGRLPKPGRLPKAGRLPIPGRLPKAGRLPEPTRRVLILDVENVCPSSKRPAKALARLRAVLDAAGPVDQVIAASAASQHARLDHLLHLVGVKVHTRCKNRPNSADRALIEAARRFARSGDCEVIVASNDHCFSVVAGLPGVRRFILVTQPQLATARSLIRVANELRVAA